MNVGFRWLLVATAFWTVSGREGLAQPVGDQGDSRPPWRRDGDTICGPRCVQYLLRYYGKADVDLNDLVRECQWPELEEGASLDALERALRARGIATAALRTAPDADLRWPYPLLLHLKGNRAGGHYAVWLPGSPPGRASVWMGLAGVRNGPRAALDRHRSGVLLLTSPTPISDPESAVGSGFGRRSVSLWLLTSAALVALIAGGCRRRWASIPLPPVPVPGPFIEGGS